SAGMLGRAWMQLLEACGMSAIAPRRDALDITDANAIAKHITSDTPIVINCTGWTDVDAAEAHEAEATAINGDAVGLLARRCTEVNALLVHYSTDYVFAGNASRPYAIDAPTSPLGAYGRSKLAGET